jgi:hypothetical protein
MLTKTEVLGLTDDQLELMTPKALAEVFNAAALHLGQTVSVKRFADRTTALRRTRLMVSALRNLTPEESSRFSLKAEDIESGFVITEENAQTITGERTLIMPIMEDEVLKTGRVKPTKLATIARAEVKAFNKEKAEKKAAPKPAKPVSTDGEFLPSVAATMRKMIADGLTNDEIWAKCQPHFGMAEHKRNYPAWYRAEMNRKNNVTPGNKEEVM